MLFRARVRLTPRALYPPAGLDLPIDRPNSAHGLPRLSTSGQVPWHWVLKAGALPPHMMYAVRELQREGKPYPANATYFPYIFDPVLSSKKSLRLNSAQSI